MRAVKVFLASGIIVFALFFLNAIALRGDSVELGGRVTLGVFELSGTSRVAVSSFTGSVWQRLAA